MIFNFLQNSFNGGILSSNLFARIDIAQYQKSLLQCENFLVNNQGQLYKRGGFDLVYENIKFNKKIVKIYNFYVNEKYNFLIIFYELPNNLGIKIYDLLNQDICDLVDENSEDSPFLEKNFDLLHSGNTLFLVHQNCPPSKITMSLSFFEGKEVVDFTYEVLNFGINMPLVEEITEFSVDNFRVISAPNADYALPGEEVVVEFRNSPKYKPDAQGGQSNIIGHKLLAIMPRSDNNINSSLSAAYPDVKGSSTSLLVNGYWSLTTTGTWNGTITMQRSYISGDITRNDIWEDFQTFVSNSDSNFTTSDTEKSDKNVWYRFIFYSRISGTCSIRFQNTGYRSKSMFEIIEIIYDSNLKKIDINNTSDIYEVNSNEKLSINSSSIAGIDYFGKFKVEVATNRSFDKTSILHTFTSNVHGNLTNYSAWSGYEYTNTTSSEQFIRVTFIRYASGQLWHGKGSCMLAFSGAMKLPQAKFKLIDFAENMLCPVNMWSREVLYEDWGDIRGYPSTVAFCEERLVFAGQRSVKNKIWLSRVSDWLNFNSGALADDAFNITLNSDTMNEIMWIVQKNDLIIGTTDSEWVLSSSQNEPLSATNFQLARQSNFGASPIKGRLLTDSVVMCSKDNMKIREYFYTYEKEGYMALDLTILSEQLFKKDVIKDIIIKQLPDTQLWCVLESGRVAIMTYNKDHEVTAWQLLTGLPITHITINSINNDLYVNCSEESLLIAKYNQNSVLDFGRKKIVAKMETLPVEFFSDKMQNSIMSKKTIHEVRIWTSDAVGGKVFVGNDSYEIQSHEWSDYFNSIKIKSDRIYKIPIKSGWHDAVTVRVEHDLPYPFTMNALACKVDISK